MSETLRIGKHPALDLTTSDRVTFRFDGTPYEGIEGEPLAYSLYAAGVRVIGFDERDGTARGLFCGIGHCYSCRVTVDGVPDVRACLVPVRPGMDVFSQRQPGSGVATK